MKYRIVKENNKYRAEIGKENKFGKLVWTAIENDNNDDLLDRTCYYSTIEIAVNAAKLHHIKEGYDKSEPEVVKTFEL